MGTGLGSFSPRLAEICDRYVGLEYDPASVEATAKRLGPRGQVLQGDARKMPFPPQSFSAVVCLEVLEHLGDWRAGVAGIHRCLKPEGTAIVSVPYRKAGGKSESNPYHLYEPGERELVECFRQLFCEVELFYQFFEESLAMRLARVLHIRRFVGLSGRYRELVEGRPEALARLKIGAEGRGLKLHILLAASRPKSSGM